MPKFIMIFEPDTGKESGYLRSLESLGHIIHFVNNEEDLLVQAAEIVPDVIILNDTAQEVNTAGILKTLRADSLLANCSCLMLVNKVGHASIHRAKVLKVDIEEFPIHNHHLMQMIKKITKGLVLPAVEIDNESPVLVNAHIELVEFNSLGFYFLAPMKFTVGGQVSITSDFVTKIGHSQVKYEVDMQGKMHESGSYLNHVVFKGVSVDVQNNMKQYERGTLK